jgi:hypothetical protein
VFSSPIYCALKTTNRFVAILHLLLPKDFVAMSS